MSQVRRLFIIRKDLNLSSGKLSAMVGHATELWWIELVKSNMTPNSLISNPDGSNGNYKVILNLDRDIVDKYIYDIYTKTVCEAKNLENLKKKVSEFVQKYNLSQEHNDYGWINDKCLTELTPENPDGTTTIGVWFRPMEDEVIHELSKRFKLYKD